MDNRRRLKIAKNVRADPYDASCVVAIWLVLFCVSFYFVICYTSQSNRVYGEDTARILHDVNAAFPRSWQLPGHFWQEHPFFINGSTYTEPTWGDTGLLEMFMIHFDWETQLHLFIILIDLLLRTRAFICLGFSIHLKDVLTWKRCIAFVFLSVLYSVLLLAALDGTLSICYVHLRDSLLHWIETSVVEVTLEDKGTAYDGQSFCHPFTLCHAPPFYLDYIYRYLYEDVVFVCEYNVTGDEDADPRTESAWWNKNGAPVIENEKIHINISIERIEVQGHSAPVSSSRTYKIRSSLTIEMIDVYDYGRYTCNYINPLPNTVKVDVDVASRNRDTSSEYLEPNPPPMTPHPECDCKPTFWAYDMAPQNHHVKTDSPMPYLRKLCIREFELQRRPFPVTNVVKVGPGGILIDVANYRTVAHEDDIQIDISSEEKRFSKANHECCSIFIKLYWIFFRNGAFIGLPVSRHTKCEGSGTTNNILVRKWMCVCSSSPLLLNNIFYRNLYNRTINMTEQVEIHHPVNLQRQSPEKWSVRGEHLHRFGNPRFTVYIYDVFLIVTLVVLAYFLLKFLQWSRRYIVIPMRKCCFYLFTNFPAPFAAVQGPALNRLGGNRQHKNAELTYPGQSYGFDIFLSYNEEERYDKAVAQEVKRIMLDRNLRVFDVASEIPYGHPTSLEISSALPHCSRFIIILSSAYTEDDGNKMEHMAIQDVIISQGTKPKERLLIVQLEECNVTGLHRVPCIRVPDGMKDRFVIDPTCINRLKEWEQETRPGEKGDFSRIGIISQLRMYGVGMGTVLIIISLVYLASRSTLFVDLEPSSQFPDVCPDMDEDCDME